MIQINCCICKNKLESPGALLFSIPDNLDMSYKRHICKNCVPHVDHAILVATLKCARKNQRRVTLKEAQAQAERVMAAAKEDKYQRRKILEIK